MYRAILLFSLVWSSLCLLPVRASDRPEPSSVAKAAAEARARQELLAIEKQWTTAEDKHDAATLGRILDDQFVLTFGTSAPPRDKAGFIQQMMSGEIDPTASQSLTDPTVVIAGDTAIVVATDTMHGTDKGRAYSAVFRYTATYIRRNGQWVALAEHIVRAPQRKPGQ